jgi:outer membrane immunogenic protein
MNFRSAFLACVAGSVLAVAATGANADGYSRGSLKDHRLPFSWTGFYVGGVASYAWGDSKHCDDLTCSKPGVVYPAFDLSGGLGGVTVGYNAQMGKLVAGVEADWSWGSVDGSSPSTPGFNCLGSCATEVTSIGTVRGRLGYAFGNLLPYVTAGAAFTTYNASIGGPIVVAEDTTTKTSFTAGGGLEFAFSRHWSGKVEYLYISRLGDFAYDSGVACGAPPGNCFSRTDRIDTVRLGLNYRF